MAKYRTIDVLVGLRSKYLQVQKNLDILGLITNVSADRSLLRARYAAINPHDMSGKPEIVCTFEDNTRTLKGKINYLRKYVFGTYRWGLDSDHLVRDEKGNFVLSSSPDRVEKPRHKAVIGPDWQEDVNNLINEIVTSSLYNPENQKDLTSDDLEFIVRLVDGFDLFSRTGDYRLSYHEHNDTLYVRGDGELIRSTRDALENHLFDESKLTPFQKDVIAESGVQGKKLYITTDGPALERVTFSISDDENSILILKKSN